MATWTDLTFTFGSLLTSTKMTQLDANLDALAEQATGAPIIEKVRGWVQYDNNGTPNINDSFNVSTVDDLGVGNFRVNWATDFATPSYAVAGVSLVGTDAGFVLIFNSILVGSTTFKLEDNAGIDKDSDANCIIAMGDQ